MGDRGNIYMIDTADRARGLYLYSHWCGSALPELLRRALVHGKPRWDDEPYLARIVIDQVFADARDELTGSGISTFLTDNQYPITVLDIPGQTVAWATEGQEDDPSAWVGIASLTDYVAQEHATYPQGM